MKLINRCPHAHIQGIFGDQINHHGGYRLRCDDCGRLLDGPADLAHPKVELARIRSELTDWRDLQQHNAQVQAKDGDLARALRSKLTAHQINMILQGDQ